MPDAPTKAFIQNLTDKVRYEVMFNPTSYSSATRTLVAKTESGVQFQAISQPDFTVELFFDTYETNKDVRKSIKPIADLQKPTSGEGTKSQPPSCMFSWGKFQYTGLISEISQTFTLFNAEGIPVRADVRVTFISLLTSRQALENAGLDNCRKLKVIHEGERLDLIAARETGSPANWRAIAAANGVDDPLAFPERGQVGRVFLIPDIGPVPRSET